MSELENHIKKDREKINRIADKILEEGLSNKNRLMGLISPAGVAAFVLCGVSGIGKTRGIEAANERFEEGGGRIIEFDLFKCRDCDEAKEKINNVLANCSYEGNSCVCFSTVSIDLAERLQSDEKFPWQVIFL